VQTFPDEHATPHVPQLELSLCRFVQAPLQIENPVWHVTAQLPPLQTVPEGQAKPQLPQCAWSVVRFTHVPPQLVSPAWQLRVQTPLMQIFPARQLVPQLPQWLISVSRLAQVAPQFCCSIGQLHTIPHCQPVKVLTNTCPIPHAEDDMLAGVIAPSATPLATAALCEYGTLDSGCTGISGSVPTCTPR
jgi:hypothetical protein